jgi:hypothetical protein
MIRRISSSLKPALKEENMRARLQFCLDMLDGRTTGDANPTFISMHNIVHIDEKWFNTTKKIGNTICYLKKKKSHIGVFKTRIVLER